MIYTINNNQINTDTREVIFQGDVKNVEPLIFKLLVFMLENPERVLAREELIEKVWNSRYISDSALSAAISTARHVVGDNGKLQQCIKTVSGSGYRFIAPFTQSESSVPSSKPSLTNNPPFYIKPQEDNFTLHSNASLKPPEIPEMPSLVVMDFIDLSKNQEASLLAFGLTAEVNSALARYPHLFVIARASASNISKLELPAKVVGEHLGVRYLIYGNIQQAGKRIRVSLTIVDASKDKEIWSEHFEHAVDDIFLILDDITQSIVAVTDSVIETAEIERSYKTPTEDLNAWENFHRGLWYIDRTSLADTHAAEKYFTAALKQDPHFARAFAGLSYIHTNRLFLNHKPISENNSNFIKASDFAQRCVDSDSHEMVGYMCLGRVKVAINQLDISLPLLEQALNIAPNSPHSLGIKAQALARLGNDYSGSIDCLDQCERLNPYSRFNQFNINFTRTVTLLYQKKYSTAGVYINRLIHYNENYYLGFALEAVYHQLTDDKQKAQRSVASALKHLPNCSIESCQRMFSEKKEPRQRFINALIEAGMPSSSTHSLKQKETS
jgi:TolB-like protein